MSLSQLPNWELAHFRYPVSKKCAKHRCPGVLMALMKLSLADNWGAMQMRRETNTTCAHRQPWLPSQLMLSTWTLDCHWAWLTGAMEARALSRLKFRDTWGFLDSCPGQHLWSCMLSGSRVGEGKRQAGNSSRCYLVCTCPVFCRSDGRKQGPHGRRVDLWKTSFIHFGTG